MIESGLVAMLSADATLTALIGARLYPVLVPESAAYPCLSYQVITGRSVMALDATAIQEKSIQFDAWSTAYADCKNVQAALSQLLDGFSGALPDGTRVLSAYRILELDSFEDGARVYRSLAEYKFQFV